MDTSQTFCVCDPSERLPAEATRRQFDVFRNSSIVQTIAETMCESFVVLNHQRQIVFANEQFVLLLNRGSLESILGLRYGEAFSCRNSCKPPDGCGTTPACALCGVLRTVLATQAGHREIQECRILTEPFTRAMDLRVFGRPFSHGGNEFSLLVIHDITDEKRRIVLERIFFHDLLNLAIGLEGLAETVCNEDAPLSHEPRIALRQITGKLIEEINAQKDLAAAERQELAVHPVPIDSQNLAREIVDLYRHHPAARGRTVVLAPDSKPVQFRSDRVLVRRVLGNMVKNAIEAARLGEAASVWYGSTPDGVEFRVHNPSLMPPDVQMQIFQRSFSTKGHGRGLGTYSMKLLTEQYLHGTMAFISTPGNGTIFFARYPLDLPMENEAAQMPPARVAKGATP